jgi:hypothetical protein
MSIGGEIKVVLTLDDSGFTLKTQRATEQSSALNEGLKGLQSSAAGVEAPLADLAGTMQGIAQKMGDFAKQAGAAESAASPLGKTVAAAADSIAQFATGLSKASESASQAKQQIAGVTEAAAPAAKTLADVSAAAQKVTTSSEKAVPALLKSREALLEQGVAAATTAAKVDTAATQMAASFNRTLPALLQSKEAWTAMGQSADVAASKSTKAVAALLQAPSAAMKAALANTTLAGSATKAAGAKNQQSEAATKATQSNAALTKAITSLESVIAKLAGTVIQLVKANNNLAASTDKNTVSTDALTRVTQANTSATAAQGNAMTAAGRNMSSVRGQADALTESLKGMAQMWAALKIENGLKASVDDADQMQRQRVVVDALNMPATQTQEFFDRAFDLTKTNQFLSQLDAVKSRMSAISAVGENNVGTIDATLQTAVRAANNLQQLGMAHGDMQSTIRNLYGVAETRAQIGDNDATNRTFNTVQKISTGTGGKVSIADIETMLRSLGSGAQQISDDGLVNLAAVIDQFKVSGGEGGGGSGVSRVGTAYKMFQQYALGKQMTDQAVQIFAGSNLLNTKAIDFNGDAKNVRFQAKHAGLVDGDLAASDPVQWLQKHYDEILSFTQKKQNAGKYFDGKNINDPQAQAVAIQKVLVGLGITTTAAQAMSTAMNPASAHRINVQRETINGSKGVDDVNAELMKNYSGAVTQFKANLTDLGTMIGTSVLPQITALIQGINSLFDWFKRIGQENPALVQLNTLAAAAGGVVLAFAGFAKLTGLVGGVISVISQLAGVGAAPAALASATTAATATASTALTGLLEGIGLFVASAGRLFLRAIPYVGWLLVAWDLTKLIGGLEVGGHKVEDWFQHWFDSLQSKATTFWLSLKRTFADIASWKLPGSDGPANSTPAKTGFVSRTDSNAHGTTTGGQNQRAAADTVRTQAAEAARIAREAAFNDPTSDVREANRFASLAPKAPVAPAVPRGGVDLDDTDAQKLAAGMARPKREFEDPFVKFREQIASKAKVDQGDLDALTTRQPKGMDALRADALTEFTAKWQGGDFDKAHDPRNRQWANADGSLDTSNATVQATVDQMAKLKQLEEQKKAITFANERLASTENDLKEAMTNASDDGAAKQTREMTALERELARAEERLGSGTKAFQEWNLRKNEALQNRAGADLLNFTTPFKAKDEQTIQSLLPFDSQRRTAAYDAQNSKDLDQYRKLQQTLQQDTSNAVSAAQASPEFDNDPSARAAKVKEIQQKGLNDQLMAEQAFNQHLEVVAAERARLLRTPMDGLVETWKDTLKSMQDAEAGWANQVIDTLMQFVETGKLNISKLAESMALDVLKIKLQETFSDPLKMGLDALTSGINKLVFPNASTAAGQASTVANAGASQFSISGLVNGLTSLTPAASDLKAGFTTLTSQGVQTTTNALGTQVTQMLATGNVQGATTTSLGALANAALVAAQALAQVGGSSAGSSLGGLFGSLGSALGSGSSGSASAWGVGSNSYGFTMPSAFADGGIMTGAGAVQLRKYATGGIASSPQLALYGEGSMAEAYVPLPDGRSIPVTINSGQNAACSNSDSDASQMPSVTVNVINQTGQQVQSQQQGQARFDGKQMVLDVVLTAAQTPGTFRDGLKSAMK